MSALLEVAGVSKSYGGIQALAGCDLAVQEGAINGLIGPNGSGKTTLFNVITGYERDRSGEVRFRGRAITNAPPDRVFALGIGRTFQLTRIFGRLTVLENMLVATQRHEGWLRGVLRRSGSASERRARVRAARVRRHRRAGRASPRATSSYGQRKLLELASLLVADPAVLLLDEPAGGVNPTLINAPRRADHASSTSAGKTFIIVEHNMEFVMACATGSPCSTRAARSSRARPRGARPTRRCSTPTSAARTTMRPARRRGGGHGRVRAR